MTHIFPDRVVNDEGDARIQGGLTLRDYFAAQALSGLVTRDDLESVYSAAQKAYRLADIMLETRDQ